MSGSRARQPQRGAPAAEPLVLLDQQLALSAYFEALLTQPPAPAQAPEETPVVIAPVAAPAVPAPPAGPPPVQEPAPPSPAPVHTREAFAPPPAAAADITPPEAPFQALLFQVAGVTLAVPLVELAGVMEWPEELTAVPAQPRWHLGLLARREGAAPVVDLAELILPPERRPPDAQRHWRRIVLVGGGRWGLASEAVDEVVTLAPEEVRWRSARTRRAWLAGTVIARMCALLDAPALVRMLDGGMRP